MTNEISVKYRGLGWVIYIMDINLNQQFKIICGFTLDSERKDFVEKRIEKWDGKTVGKFSLEGNSGSHLFEPPSQKGSAVLFFFFQFDLKDLQRWKLQKLRQFLHFFCYMTVVNKVLLLAILNIFNFNFCPFFSGPPSIQHNEKPGSSCSLLRNLCQLSVIHLSQSATLLCQRISDPTVHHPCLPQQMF